MATDMLRSSDSSPTAGSVEVQDQPDVRHTNDERGEALAGRADSGVIVSHQSFLAALFGCGFLSALSGCGAAGILALFGSV